MIFKINFDLLQSHLCNKSYKLNYSNTLLFLKISSQIRSEIHAHLTLLLLKNTSYYILDDSNEFKVSYVT